MKVAVIGTGFVGVVTAGVLSSFNNEVVGVDIDPNKVESLNNGQVPFHEPGLVELLQQELQTGRLRFTTDYATAIPGAKVIMVAVGTPSAPDGNADLTYVYQACESLSGYLEPGSIVAIKSTVPPGIFSEIERRIRNHTQVEFSLASLPEFLREGSAVEDTLHPDRVVIGCSDPQAREILKELHAPLGGEVVEVRPESAQMGKYAANAYLALRITFANQVADLCEENGADIEEVISVMGKDKRIGSHYWYPGLGYGGSCFPKDVREIAAYSRTVGLSGNIFNKMDELNENRIFEKLQEFGRLVGGWRGKKVAVLGLSFKKFTDDMREAPSTKIIPQLLYEEAQVVGYDPMATEGAMRLFGEKPGLQYAESIQAAIQDADVVMALVEWPEIVEFPYWEQPPQGANGQRCFIDARNQISAEKMRSAGWRYIGIGRGERV
jgi:UDPglucose 6-dehydrogenase